jgi:hypothetical protein
LKRKLVCFCEHEFESEVPDEAFYRGTLSYPVAEVDRVAIGYDELVEKLRIREAKLDDRVVEVLKYYLLQKALEHYEGEAEVRLLFHSREEAGLVFHAIGLKEGEVGVLRVSTQMAQKAAAQLEQKLREDPFSLILKGPYVSINKLATESPEDGAE